MALPQRFLFDVSFDHIDGIPAARGAERRFSRNEMEAARQTALAEGKAAGLAEAAQAAESLTASSLAIIAQEATALVAAQDATALDTQRRAMTLIQDIMTKLFPGLAAKNGLAEVEAFATKCLHEVFDEPRVVLRVANEIYEPLRERIADLAGAAGFAGRVVLLADEGIAPGDARIEWADGGAERDLAAQTHQIEAAIARRADPAVTANPLAV
jgi:flagellar assembly protein FliH